MSKRGRLSTGPLQPGEIAVHVVCHDCPFETLVTRHHALADVKTRAKSRVREHSDASGHNISSEVVRG